MQKNSKSGAGSMTLKIASEAAIMLGGSRAVLMQIAHPLVAMGVSTHSSYMSDPFGRTEHTFILGQKITFGSSRTIHDAARTINRLHTHVYGTLPMHAGAFESGAPYKARDPELLLWVHASLIDTILLIYPLLIGPLSLDEQDEYYQELRKQHVCSASPPKICRLPCKTSNDMFTKWSTAIVWQPLHRLVNWLSRCFTRPPHRFCARSCTSIRTSPVHYCRHPSAKFTGWSGIAANNGPLIYLSPVCVQSFRVYPLHCAYCPSRNG